MRRETSTILEHVIAKPELFTWGEIVQIHEVGEYAVAEYLEWERDGITIKTGAPSENHSFFVWVDGRSTSHSYNSLDAALAGAIAYKYEGANHRADWYFMRSILPEKELA